jgi:hypothetical protein
MIYSLGQVGTTPGSLLPASFWEDFRQEIFGGQPTLTQGMLAVIGIGALLIWGTHRLEKEARRIRKKAGL